MRVYVKVAGAEAFPVYNVRTRAELQRVLDFARIGSQTGSPRLVYKMGRRGRPMLIARYENGQSRTSAMMRARRNPLWEPASSYAIASLLRGIFG